jgi:cyanate permease
VEAGRQRGGLSAAIFNTGGNAGGILAPAVTPWVSDALGFGWQTGLSLGSVVCLAGAACWLWIVPDEGLPARIDTPSASAGQLGTADSEGVSRL